MSVGDREFSQGGRPSASVRIGAIGEAWGLFKDRWTTWVLAALIVLACNSIASGVVFDVFRGPRPAGPGGFRFPLPPPRGEAVPMALTMIINGFFLGGMSRMACRQVRGKSFGIETLFGVTDVLANLMLGSAMYGLALLVGFLVFVIPGLVAAGVLMFTFPLIVDARLPATEAVRRSWDALKGEWLSASLFHLVAWSIAGVGSCLCCVGIVVTAPLYSLSIAVLYRDFFLAAGDRPLEKPAPPESDF